MPRHAHVQAEDSLSVQAGVTLKAYASLSNLGRFSVTYEEIELRIRDNAPETFPTVVTIKTLVQFENQAIFTYQQLADKTGTTPLTISRHMKKLRELKLIIPDPASTNHISPNVWRVHPLLVWRGTAHAVRAYLDDLPATHPWHTYAVQKEVAGELTTTKD